MSQLLLTGQTKVLLEQPRSPSAQLSGPTRIWEVPQSIQTNTCYLSSLVSRVRKQVFLGSVKIITETLKFLQKMLGWLVHLCCLPFHHALLLSVTSNKWGKEERQYQNGKSKQYRKIVSAPKPAQRDLCAVLLLSPPIFLHNSSILLFPPKFSSC